MLAVDRRQSRSIPQAIWFKKFGLLIDHNKATE